MQYDTPILFIFFCRKHIAIQSFERIRQLRPSKLYLACDGPRCHINGETDVVAKTRQAIIDSIDWNCQVMTLFQDTNLGCGMGVYTAINWFFENEEEGIIYASCCNSLSAACRMRRQQRQKFRCNHSKYLGR